MELSSAMSFLPTALVMFATFAVVKYVLSYRRWEQIAVVEKLYLYPLKSAKPMTPDALHCSRNGVQVPNSNIRDRSFMVVLPSGAALTAKASPPLVLVELEILKGKAKVQAPGMDTITFAIPQESKEPQRNCRVLGYNVPGIDCGDEVSEWFEKYTGEKGVRLVYHDAKMQSKKNDKLCSFKNLDVYHQKPITSEFQNWTPVSILSRKSLDDLNQKLQDENLKVTERNFRPNIFLSECPAYAEDKWRRIKIGSAELVFGKQCARCAVTTVCPQTGVKHPEEEPLATLKKFRTLKLPAYRALNGASPVFSSDYVVANEGDFRVGDIVYGMK